MEGSEDRIATEDGQSGGRNAEANRSDHYRISASEADAVSERRKKAGIEEAPDGSTPTIGLALSGGGIRSATFALGLLRGLARNGVLKRFDYLSTVSGGGYTGAVFGRLVGRKDTSKAKIGEGEDDVPVLGIEGAEALLARSDSKELAWLRRYGRYLAPTGARDYGVGIATYLRSIIAVHLEFAIASLFITALAIAPHVLQNETYIFQVGAWNHWGSVLWPLALGFWLIFAPGTIMAYWLIDSHVDDQKKCARLSTGGFVVIVASVAFLGYAAHGGALTEGIGKASLRMGLILVLLGFVICGAALLLYLFRKLDEQACTIAEVRRKLTLRLRGVNMAAFVLFLLGLVDWTSWQLLETMQMSDRVLIGGVGTGGLLLLLLRSLSDPLQKWFQPDEGRGFDIVPLLINVAGFGLAFGLVVVWAALAQGLVFKEPAETSERWLWVLIAPVAWVILTSFSHASVNASSLHTTYCSRLVRAYLGAVNEKRLNIPRDERRTGDVENETQFNIDDTHPDDDIDIGSYAPHKHGGPIHLINVCLNQTRVQGSALYNADRKGVPMTVSSCGVTRGEESVPLDVEKLGTLGRWVAISGAVASPGAGSYTTPGWAALLFMAGVRLGYWLDAWKLNPAFSAKACLQSRIKEWFANTKAGRLRAEFSASFYGPYGRAWHLSDGGHFDNTGVHALIARQLDFIVLADCGADSTYGFSDLENLVRKARIDYGADIAFYTGKDAADTLLDCSTSCIGFLSPEKMVDNFTGRGVMLARIQYREQGGRRKQGTLLVVKPNLHDALDMDILGYAQRNPAFPQQTTGDQFFDESQWESYQRLGEDFGMHMDQDWMSLLPGWKLPIADEDSRFQVREARLKPSGEAATEKPFWKRAAKDAAVGALSVGALFAVAAPTWQAIDQWRATRLAEQEETLALLGRTEDLLMQSARTGAEAAAYGRIMKESGLSSGLDSDPVATLRAIFNYLDRYPADRALMVSDWKILRSLRRALDTPMLAADFLHGIPLQDLPPLPPHDAPAAASASNKTEPLRLALRDFGMLLEIRIANAERSPRQIDQWRVSRLKALADMTAPTSPDGMRLQAVVRAAAESCKPPHNTLHRELCGQIDPKKHAPTYVYWTRPPLDESDKPGEEKITIKPREEKVIIPELPTTLRDPPTYLPDPPPAPPMSAPLALIAMECSAVPTLYIQVYDETARRRVAEVPWSSVAGTLSMPGIENVVLTAAARGGKPPEPHRSPLLLVHDRADGQACGRAVADWLSVQLGLTSAISVRNLPRPLLAQPGVLELWLPPSQDETEDW